MSMVSFSPFFSSTDSHLAHDYIIELETYIFFVFCFCVFILAAMSAAQVAGKVAPKTIYQFRNVCYAFAAWWGLTTGVSEKLENDRLWAELRAREVAKRVSHQNAKEERRLKKEKHQSKSEIPDVIPPELHGVYKSVTGK